MRYEFPNNTVCFGKYFGKELSWIIDNDRPYYNWMLSVGKKVSPLIEDYANGINKVHEKIWHVIDKSKDELRIKQRLYYVLPAVKFVNREKKKIISEKVIAIYPIRIPFTTHIEHRSETRDYTKFHCDVETYEWDVVVKTYDEKKIQKFIANALKNHTHATSYILTN